MSERERADSGQFVETVTLDDVLDVFDQVDGPVVTSSDVAEARDCTTEAARQKLTRLYDRGEVDKRKTGRTVVYWRTGDEQPDPRDAAESAEAGVESDTVDTTPDSNSHREPQDAPRDGGGSVDDAPAVDAAISKLDTTADRRDAVRACVEYLREHGTGRKSEFVDAVYADHPAGFGSAGGWWNKIGKEYLQTVAEDVAPLVPPAGEGSHTWQWTGGSDGA